MKRLYILLLFVGTTAMAQLKGNGEIIERNFPIENIHTLEINLTADFILDAKDKNGFIIKTDSNLIDYISKEFENGYLNISQAKWIQPTQRPQIRIGIASLKKLINDAHSSTQLLNLDQDSLEIVANVGRLNLSGNLGQLDLLVGTASLRAEELKVRIANVKITSFGTALLNVKERVNTSINTNGRLSFVEEPLEITGNYSDLEEAIADTKPHFINIKLKNNSWGRNKYVVVGPKADGSTFSYGFELWPLQSKEERWTIGSELFEVNKLGKRISVLKLTAKNENSIIKLY